MKPFIKYVRELTPKIREFAASAKSYYATYQNAATSYSSTYSEKLESIVLEANKVFDKTIDWADDHTDEHDWVSISRLFDFFDRIELLHNTIIIFLTRTGIKQNKVANEKWAEALNASRELYARLFEEAIRATRKLLEDPVAAERFTTWITENRRNGNAWILRPEGLEFNRQSLFK
jgi:hypothetical protein